jgi:hypothetical protein
MSFFPSVLGRGDDVHMEDGNDDSGAPAPEAARILVVKSFAEIPAEVRRRVAAGERVARSPLLPRGGHPRN